MVLAVKRIAKGEEVCLNFKVSSIVAAAVYLLRGRRAACEGAARAAVQPLPLLVRVPKVPPSDEVDNLVLE